MTTEPLSIERLRSLLAYSPESGTFRWKVATSFRVKIGDEAGVAHPNGRLTIGIDGKKYLRSRLAWAYVHGSWPAHEIDHADRDQTNDRIGNLRAATHLKNSWNRGSHKDAVSKFLGVEKKRDKWAARICRDGERTYLGSFATEQAAARAYDEAARKLFGEFANLNFAAAA